MVKNKQIGLHPHTVKPTTRASLAAPEAGALPKYVVHSPHGFTT